MLQKGCNPVGIETRITESQIALKKALAESRRGNSLAVTVNRDLDIKIEFAPRKNCRVRVTDRI